MCAGAANGQCQLETDCIALELFASKGLAIVSP